MIGLKEGNCGRVIAEFISPKEDLLNGVRGLVKKAGVRSGVFWAIGTLEKAHLLHYDGARHDIEPQGPFEISTCMGNVSVMDDQAWVHCHAVVSDAQGRSFGGHLMEGSAVGVHGVEIVVVEVGGVEFQRKIDRSTSTIYWP